MYISHITVEHTEAKYLSTRESSAEISHGGFITINNNLIFPYLKYLTNTQTRGPIKSNNVTISLNMKRVEF